MAKGSVAVPAIQYPELAVKAYTPETATLFLSSPEASVVLQALNSLNKYVELKQENTYVLRDINTIEAILKNNLWAHENIYIKRFSFKLLAEIFQYADIKFEAKFYEEVFRICRNEYLTYLDNFLTEYAALVLLKMMDDSRICKKLEKDPEFTPGFLGILGGTTDPDILYNTYHILIKMFKFLPFYKACDIEGFPFERILADACNVYPEIQKSALTTLEASINCSNEYFQNRYGCPDFFSQMFNIIENEDSKDCHPKALNLIQPLMKIEQMAIIFNAAEFLPRLYNYMREESACKLEAVGVVSQLAKHESILDSLHTVGFTEMLIEFLRTNQAIGSDILIGLERMLKHPEAFIEINKADIPPQVISILIAALKYSLQTRQAAANLLASLIKRTLKSAESAIKSKIGDTISSFLHQPYGQLPHEFIISNLKVLIAIAKYPETREKVMTKDLATSLFYAVKDSYRGSLLMANLFNCMAAFACEPTLVEHIVLNNIDKVVVHCLRSSSVLLRTATSDFTLVTGKKRCFSDLYINHGVLETLLKDDISITTCPSWSPAIEAILSTDPSLKFCIRGRLDISDITGDDFVVSRHYWTDFVVLRRLCTDDVSPIYPLLLVNFNHTNDEVLCATKIGCPHRKLVPVTEDSQNVQEWSYCRRPVDLQLPKYLNRVKEMLEARGLMDPALPNAMDITKITDRIKVVAEVVCNEMCGPLYCEFCEGCPDHAVVNHLNELKYKLHCNIIPLGSVKYGGYFERAILFKGLADQIGLPCTLVRGVQGKILFNEVPVPIRIQKVSSLNAPPINLLKPTHIVDLIENPGELYPLESRKAYQYLKLL